MSLKKSNLVIKTYNNFNADALKLPTPSKVLRFQDDLVSSEKKPKVVRRPSKHEITDNDSESDTPGSTKRSRMTDEKSDFTAAASGIEEPAPKPMYDKDNLHLRPLLQ